MLQFLRELVLDVAELGRGEGGEVDFCVLIVDSWKGIMGRGDGGEVGGLTGLLLGLRGGGHCWGSFWRGGSGGLEYAYKYGGVDVKVLAGRSLRRVLV